jgi:hypothetical protein
LEMQEGEDDWVLECLCTSLYSIVKQKICCSTLIAVDCVSIEAH